MGCALPSRTASAKSAEGSFRSLAPVRETAAALPRAGRNIDSIDAVEPHGLVVEASGDRDDPRAATAREGEPASANDRRWLFKLEAFCLWLAVAGALFTIGRSVAVEMDSYLVGFLAADFLFLIVASFGTWTSGSSHRVRR